MTQQIDNLLSALYNLEASLKSKLYNSEKETQTETQKVRLAPVLRLPLQIQFLILSYLNFIQDIPALLESCKTFNLFISSPSFLQLTFKPKPKGISLSFPQPKPEEQKNSTNQSFPTINEALAELKKTAAVSSYVNNKIQSQEKIIDERSVELEKLVQRLRIEKNIFNKALGKLSKVQEAFDEVANQRKICQGLIENKEILEDTEKKLHLSDQETVQIEISALKNAVRVLSIEKRLQESQVNDKVLELTQYKNAFHKTKDFYFLMFEDELKKKILSFDEIRI